MAYAWIKVHANLKRHPRVIALSDLLADDLAFAYLISLWSWTCEFAPTGRITAPVPARLIERECGWRGEQGKLYRILVSERWLEELSPTELSVHGWEEYQRPHIEKAEKEAQRLRRYRSKLKEKDQNTGTRTRTEVKHTQYSTGISTHDVREKRRGEEKREEENTTMLFADAPSEPVAEKAPRGRPPKDTPEIVTDRNRWLEKARALVGLTPEESPEGKQLCIRFAQVRKKRGMDQLMRALEGLEGDPWARKLGIVPLLSDAVIEKGLARYNAGASGVHVSRVQHRVGSSADGYDPFL